MRFFTKSSVSGIQCTFLESYDARVMIIITVFHKINICKTFFTLSDIIHDIEVCLLLMAKDWNYV